MGQVNSDGTLSGVGRYVRDDGYMYERHVPQGRPNDKRIREVYMKSASEENDVLYW